MSKAWAIARGAARRFNAPVRSFFAEALRQVWRQEKAVRVEIEAMKARVLHSIATLPDDLREMERQLQAWYAKQAAAAQEARRPALEAATGVVLAFDRRRAAKAAPATQAASVADRSAA